MKKGIVLCALAAILSANAMAAEFAGYVMDEECSAKAGMKGNATCAKQCIKDGSPAVLATDDGKVYKVDKAGQSQLATFAGKKVTVTGTLNGDTLTVTKIREN
jgi:hypothetical protein